MAQTNTTNNEESSRLFKRGNDQIDFEEFLRRAESGFDSWISNIDFGKKSDLKEESLRKAYSSIINSMNQDPSKFSLNLGSGFTNMAGIVNNPDNSLGGWDSNGYVASYLGNILRGMSVYTPPKKNEDNKEYYTQDSSFIDSNLQKQIIGDDIDSFMRLDLDSYNNVTGKRAYKNRLSTALSNLLKKKNQILDRYKYKTEDDRKSAEERFNSFIKDLQNENNNDDFFTLGQLGFTDVSKYFNTESDLSDEQVQTNQTNQNKTQFYNWLSANRPRYSGPGYQSRSITSADISNIQTNLTETAAQQFLINYLKTGSLNSIKAALGPNITDDQAIAVLVSTLKNKFKTYVVGQDDEGNNIVRYYLPFSNESDGNKGTAVWTYNPETNTFEFTDTHNISDYRDQYYNEYISKTGTPESRMSSWESYYGGYNYKQGGVIKAQEGIDTNKFDNILDAITYLDEDLNDDKRLRNLYNSNTSSFELVPRGNLVAIPTSNEHYMKEQGVVENMPWYDNWIHLLLNNSKLAEKWARRYKALTPDNPKHSESWFDVSDNFNFEAFKSSKVWDRNDPTFKDFMNGPGHDIYRGRVFKIEGEDGYYKNLLDGYELVGDPTLDGSNLAYVYTMRKKSSENPDKDVNSPEQNTEVQEEEPLSKLDETKIKSKGSDKKSNKPSIWRDITGQLLGVGRLAASIYANNRIANEVKKSLTPNLENTYELYSPVTGNLAVQQLKQQQANSLLRNAQRPITADANLASAMMLEGYDGANKLQQEGYLLDNQEIKRTQGEALKRREDNIARRTAGANKNREAIIKNNQALAQLEASRLKMNWGSLDDYLKELITNIKQEDLDNKSRWQSLYLNNTEFAADLERQKNLQNVQQAYRTWLSKEGNTGKTLADYNTETNGDYQRAIQDITNQYKYTMNKAANEVYGQQFEDYKNYTPFNISNYNLFIKNGGIVRAKRNLKRNK